MHFIAEKSVHVTLFFVLAVLLWRALGVRSYKIGLIIAIGAVVGSMSEGLQSLFPDRDPAIRDVLINTGGATLGALVSYVIAGRTTRSSVATTRRLQLHR